MSERDRLMTALAGKQVALKKLDRTFARLRKETVKVSKHEKFCRKKLAASKRCYDEAGADYNTKLQRMEDLLRELRTWIEEDAAADVTVESQRVEALGREIETAREAMLKARGYHLRSINALEADIRGIRRVVETESERLEDIDRRECQAEQLYSSLKEDLKTLKQAVKTLKAHQIV